MRGPLLSGAIGSPATLRRVVELLHGCGTVAVVGPPWLGAVLELAAPVLLLTVAVERKAAQRAVARARKSGRSLQAALVRGAWPLTPERLGGAVVENLAGRRSAEVLSTLAAALAPGAPLLSLDATREPATEAALASAFLAAGFSRISQLRPRSGAVITAGRTPPARLRQALAGARPAV